MRIPLDRTGRIPDVEHQILHEVLLTAEENWQLYPIHSVDADNVCACPRGAACTDPGKHPTTPRAVLDCAKRHGYMHKGRDVAVRISVRRLALDAGLGKTATQDALTELDASRLVYRASKGNGPVPGALALRVPDTDVSDTFAPPPQLSLIVPPPSVSEALYRLRHGPGRIGRSAAAVLEAEVECPGVSRAELAAKLGKKPDSLSRPLKKLVDRGLIERSRKGRYRPTDDWQQKLERELTLTGEKRAKRLDEQQYEREAYRLYLAEKEENSEG